MAKPKTIKTYTARPIDALGKAAVIWLALNAVGDAIGAGCAAFEIWMLAKSPSGSPLDEFGGIPDPEGITIYTGLARLPLMLLTIITAIIVLKWVYRANRNAHAFGRGLRSDPPWAVGWFFVPLAWLWKPFEAMLETWAVSEAPSGWKKIEAPDLMRVWWGFWLAANIFGSISSRMSFSAHDTTALLWATGAEIVSAVLSIGAGLSLLRIITKVSARQTMLIASPPIVEELAESPSVDPAKPWGA